MKTDDVQRFLENVAWFNHFFEDVGQLFEKIRKALEHQFVLTDKSLLYYPKYAYQPSIPPYSMLGLAGDDCAFQIFAVFSPVEIEATNFTGEPSFFVVKHADADKYNWVEELGMAVIRGQGIDIHLNDEKVASGKILKHDCRFYAYQLSFDEFLEGQDIDRTIHEQIVQRVHAFPGWV